VSRSDHLDDLERELGPSLRVALQRAAEGITGEPETYALSGNGAEADGLDVSVVDVEPARDQRTGRRRWIVMAAAAAAVALIIGSVLAWTATNDDAQRNPPAGPVPTSTTVPAIPGSGLLPPEGVPPSTPESGELVAAIAFGAFRSDGPGWSGVSINVYADGRLIWLPVSGVPRSGYMRGDIAEMRLTAQGVERIRQEFLSIGVFGPGQQPGEAGIWWSCGCLIRVREGGLLTTDLPSPSNKERQIDPQLDRRVDRLVEFVTHLDTALPESAFVDREVKPYAPSRYEVCTYGEDAASNAVPLPKVSAAVPRRLPTALVQILTRGRPTARSVRNSGQTEVCGELSMADARALVEGLRDAEMLNSSWAPRLRFVSYAGDEEPTVIAIEVAPLLPDGEPALMAPAG
jgi:hypothetical protein